MGMVTSMLLLELVGRGRRVFIYEQAARHKKRLLPLILHLSLRSFLIPSVGSAEAEKALSQWKGILAQRRNEQSSPGNQFAKY